MSIIYPATSGSSERELYVGGVFGTGEYNGYDDSDFYAIVWDDENGRMRNVEYGSTRYANSARVTEDITEDQATKARAWLRPLLVKEIAKAEEIRVHRVEHGAQVRSLTARGKNVGITGEVKWIGKDRYQRGLERVGIQVEGEEKLRFMNEHQVERVDIAAIDTEAIERHADALLSTIGGIFTVYRSMTSPHGFTFVA